MRVVGMSWLPPACPRSATWGARATLYWPWPPATRAGEADRPSPEEHDGVEGSWFADGDREIGYRIFHVYGGFYFFGKNCISQSWQSFFFGFTSVLCSTKGRSAFNRKLFTKLVFSMVYGKKKQAITEVGKPVGRNSVKGTN
jgi:hypothetical protein